MRGFGAVPKRGAEVGGILLGKFSGGARPTVEVEDYELVPIEYKRGPSFLLSEADMIAFRETFTRLQGAASGLSPVGMFRSSTREAVGLSREDLDLADLYFPEPDKVFLMIRPYATKVSTAGFYFREEGHFQSGPPLTEFPFRRKELGGGAAEEPARAALEQRPRARGERPRYGDSPAAESHAAISTARRPELLPEAQEAPAEADENFEIPQIAKGRTWMWLPLSFIFLLLGVLLGFQTALTMRPQASATGEPFNLSLTVAKDGDNLNVRWDRQAAAIKASRHGVLVIQDGKFSKTVDLDPGQLQTGSVIYRHSTRDVKFRLEVQIRDHTVVSENLEWIQ